MPRLPSAGFLILRASSRAPGTLGPNTANTRAHSSSETGEPPQSRSASSATASPPNRRKPSTSRARSNRAMVDWSTSPAAWPGWRAPYSMTTNPPMEWP
jgi:hypothetical protein